MAVSQALVRDVSRRPESTSSVETPFSYRMYGLRVRSDFRLPMESVAEADFGRPDLVFARAPEGAAPPEPDGPQIGTLPCHHHGVDAVAHRGPGGTWFWHVWAGTCHVLPGARQVEVYPHADATETSIGIVLAGPLSIYILHQRGIPTLHSSAVATEEGAVLFLGASGHGKSTLATHFLVRGAALLTDDALALRFEGHTVQALPSLPYLKLWQETVDGTLDLPETLPDLLPDFPKKLLGMDGRFPFAQSPTPVRGVYLVRRTLVPARQNDPVTIDKPSDGQHSLRLVLGQISAGAFLRPQEVGRFMPLYSQLLRQAPLRILRYPNGFQHRDAVYDAIMADLRGRSATKSAIEWRVRG